MREVYEYEVINHHALLVHVDVHATFREKEALKIRHRGHQENENN